MFKYNTLKYLILLFGLTIFISCKKHAKKIKISKPEVKTYTIKGQPVFTNKPNIERLYVIDSFIVFKNIVSNNKSSRLFSIYKIKEAKNYIHLFDFGITGNGPDEFEKHIVEITGQFENKGDLKMWVYERNREKLSRINIRKTLNEKKLVIDKTIQIIPGVNFDHVFYINDSKLIGNVSNMDTNIDRLRFYNPETQKVFKKIKVLNIENPHKNDLIYTQYGFNYLFGNSIGYDKSNNLIVSAMYYLDRTDVFTVNGDVVKTVNNPGEDLEKGLKLITDKKASIYNLDISITSKNIFILSSGNPVNKVYEDENLPVKVKVYDKNMNLKALIRIDDNINTFTIDEINGFIYGINYVGEQILRYDIKNILNDV